MNNYTNINFIKKILTNNDLLIADFGLEKEGLRIIKDAKLSLSKHPQIFGNKLYNPYITTDFSESQIEIITPTFDTIDETLDFLSFIIDLVNNSISEDEYIWPQSLPCILPKDHMIPIAEYEGKKGIASMEYRKQLAQRYGTKKQMISGIHYNFSFKEKTIQKLYKNTDKTINYQDFKNQIYLKISRNYLRLKWLLIYMTGNSVAAHKSFTEECINLMQYEDANNSVYSKDGISFRNSKIGYKNVDPLYPRYDTVENFVHDVNTFIDENFISEAKELYTQIRLKPKNPENYLESLEKDGIKYVEIRTIDLNPWEKTGISKKDMEFVHLFIIYLLICEESDYDNWQEESVYNEELIAQKGFTKNLKLIKDGREITFKSWANQIINQIDNLNKTLELSKEHIIENLRNKLDNPDKTYASQLISQVEKENFIDSQLKLAIKYKEESIQNFNIDEIKDNPKLLKYYQEALP